MPAVVASNLEESLEDSPARKLLHILAMEHVLEGVRLAFQPEAVGLLYVAGDVVDFRFAGGVYDVGVVGRHEWTNARPEVPGEEVVERIVPVIRFRTVLAVEDVEETHSAKARFQRA